MIRERYARLAQPRAATFDVTRPEPAAFLTRLLDQSLNHGLPVRQRGAWARAPLGRWGLPRRQVAAALRRLPRRPSEESDRLLEQVVSAWPELAGRSERLPLHPPPLSLLSLRRAGSRLSFVFGDEESPLLVVKLGHPGTDGVDQEARFLALVEPARVAPRHLGRLPDGSAVQEGLPGAAPRLVGVTRSNAHLLGWQRRDHELTIGLERLAAHTAGSGSLENQLLGPIDRALAHDLPPRVRQAVLAARGDLARRAVTVVQHGDVSAQNWLVDGERLVGLVDWEFACEAGVPGFDSAHVAMTTFEHGLGLTEWSDDAAVTSFRRAWRESPLFAGTRSAVASTASAAGVDGVEDQLCVGFFAQRLGWRLGGTGPMGLGVPAVVAMLETVATG